MPNDTDPPAPTPPASPPSDSSEAVARDLEPLAHGAGPSGEPGEAAEAARPASGRFQPPALGPAAPSERFRPLGRPLRTSIYNTYKERVCSLSEQLVRAQRPIRILDAIKWSEEVYEAIRAGGFTVVPDLGPAYWARTNPIPYDADAKIEELGAIAQQVERQLGPADPLGQIIARNCRQYATVVRMLKARGTPEFYRLSRELYGSPKDALDDDRTALRDIGPLLYDILRGLGGGQLGAEHPRDLSAEECVDILNRGFEDYFGPGMVTAVLDDGILSDAAAGADYVKIKRGARFSLRDVEILEVHEGWVHAGTTLNGAGQRVATWLAKGPPCTADVQEGLAVLLEVFSFVSLPTRARRITNRVVAIDKAEDGADLLDVIEFYRTEGLSERECLEAASRVYRGGVVTGGGPFTKDIAYCRGFVRNYNFLETCVKIGRAELIPFLFVGKVTLEDVPVLFEAARQGVVDPPRFVPRQFRDLNALAVWLAFSNFLNRIDLARVQQNLEQTIFDEPAEGPLGTS